MVQPRPVHRVLDLHFIVDDADDNAQNGVDDGTAAGTAGDEHNLAVLGEDGRRLRAEHELARGDQIGLGADHAGFRGE